ncbi:MAG TPA: S1/P1 nuclease [Candidatus Binataceae bacterium]|nr:S1/P1 nuclease [Candidatus Binataceae bacterium]
MAALVLLFFPIRAWSWGTDGHRIVAKIAADNLSPAAQSHVAGILGVTANQVAYAMETAAVLPDSRFRDEDASTDQWHFINICLQDARSDIGRRCHEGNCVTDKIVQYSRRLKDGNFDGWSAAGDFAFLIHFVGDIHQPLHAADDADTGGNCINIDSPLRAHNLHDAWDSAIVQGLESRIDSGSPETTARKLEEIYASEKVLDVWNPGHTNDIAWESNLIARADIYAPLHIPIEPCESNVLCNHKRRVQLDSDYIDRAEVVAGHQLAKAGFRLASLLNETWVQPINSNDRLRDANATSASAVSAKTISGQIIGDRRSKIYAWPGCGSYNTMAPNNRVIFPSRDAAEQAGYRAAHNCP